jgi:hypothetical protein
LPLPETNRRSLVAKRNSAASGHYLGVPFCNIDPKALCRDSPPETAFQLELRRASVVELIANGLHPMLKERPMRVPVTPLARPVEGPTRRINTKPVHVIDYSLPLSERIRRYKRALTPQQLADEVGVHLITIYKWKKARTIPFRPAGRHIKFDPAPTAEWARRREFLPLDQQ